MCSLFPGGHKQLLMDESNNPSGNSERIHYEFSQSIQKRLNILYESEKVLRIIEEGVNSIAYVEVIKRDVCIIGGGSTGTFSALHLQKAGKSIVVVEKEKVMGGHANTYTDPKTKTNVDYGVVIFENVPIVKNYLNDLRIRWTTQVVNSRKDIKFDFSTGKILANNTVPTPGSGFQTYMTQLAKYQQLDEGFFLPDPIPDDLLLPFGDFVTKYNITDVVNTFYSFAQGLGDLLCQPTLYVFKYIVFNFQKDFTEGFIVVKDVSEIYKKAHKILKNNVLLQSYPVKVVRNAFDGIEVTVRSPEGYKLIKAKKLLVSVPPKLDNLRGFDLSANETKLFRQFINTGYYNGLVSNTGLPANSFISNYNPKNPYSLPTLPGLYSIYASAVDGLYHINYGSPQSMSIECVKADILHSIDMLQESGLAEKTTPKIVAFQSHEPFELTVPVKAIKNGFYKRLYALQGQQNTFWTGAAFHTHNSGLLWRFTEDFVLPPLIKELSISK